MTESLFYARYRCVECGDGEHLFAWTQAVNYGPVGADGLLEAHEASEDCFLFEDSLQCDLHPESPVEKLVEGVYTLPITCPDCGGRGHRPMYVNVACERCRGLRQIDVPTAEVLCV